MKKTIDIAADREFDQSKTVLPMEVARGIHIENPPSAQALKLMHLLIAKAGKNMADDVKHEMRMADIKVIEGMRNHDRNSLRTLFIELSTTVMHYDDKAAKIEIIGGFMDEIRVDYSKEEQSGELIINWWFRRTFREMAAQSHHWAIIDRQTIFALRSKYSILLFQYISSLVSLDHIQSKTFTISELRSLFGIQTDKLKRFTHLNSRAIQPTIAEINQLSRFTLKATPKKIGRTIRSVEISWVKKEDISPVKRELDFSSAGRKARREGTVENIVGLVESLPQPEMDSAVSFPDEGSIRFGRWQKIALEELPTPARDTDAVADDFRVWCKSKSISFDGKNIEKIFRTFCKKQSPAG